MKLDVSEDKGLEDLVQLDASVRELVREVLEHTGHKAFAYDPRDGALYVGDSVGEIAHEIADSYRGPKHDGMILFGTPASCLEAYITVPLQ